MSTNVNMAKTLDEMKSNRAIEEKAFILTPIKKASRAITNTIATLENLTMLSRMESAKLIVESVRDIEENDWDTMKYFL